MAETSDHNPQALIEEPEEPLPNAPTEDSPAERDAREATELARLRRNYSRASTYRQQGSSIASKKPASLLERFTYGVSKFWRHQVSVTVPHDTCRDHLGMSRNTFHSRPTSFKASQTQHYGYFLFGIGTTLPKACSCNMSSGTFHDSVSQKH